MIKNINKKVLSIVMSGVTLLSVPVALSACEKLNDDGLYSIGQDNNEFDKYHKIIIRNGKPTSVYNGDNIVVSVDKDTFDVKEYIYVSSALDEVDSVYDLRTGDLLVYKSNVNIPDYNWYSKTNFNKINDNKYIIAFKDIGDYVEGESVKKYYSLNEIEELEPKIIDSMKKIKEYTKQKELN